jgi:UDP-N-acetyl-D-mannosaminuronate dehydrogenase
MSQRSLSLAVNGREYQLTSRLKLYQAAGPPAGGDEAVTSSVAIVGLGYVGLPTAIALHGRCKRIIGIDLSQQRLADIAAGNADLTGPDQVELGAALADGSLELTADPTAVKAADAVIICVPTPVDGQYVPDLAALRTPARGRR